MHEGSQGAGGFNPSGRVAPLPQDVAFLRLADADTAWPLRPRPTEEEPINPDPRYPRNHGYRFRGYFFDAAWIPTFMYRSGEVEIEDRSVADRSGEQPVLIRTLQFQSPRAETLWFRVATGRIESLPGRQYTVERLTLTLPDVPTTLREFGPDDLDELLCELALPEGTFKVTVRYELR